MRPRPWLVIEGSPAVLFEEVSPSTCSSLLSLPFCFLPSFSLSLSLSLSSSLSLSMPSAPRSFTPDGYGFESRLTKAEWQQATALQKKSPTTRRQRADNAPTTLRHPDDPSRRPIPTTTEAHAHPDDEGSRTEPHLVALSAMQGHGRLHASISCDQADVFAVFALVREIASESGPKLRAS